MTRKSAGFTLLELLVVLAVLGLAAMALPSVLGRGTGALSAAAVAAETASTLRGLRSDAITRGRPAELAVDAGSGTLRAGDGRVLEVPEGARLRFLPLAGRGAREAVLRFHPDGSSNGGRIEIVQAGRIHVVTVDWITGRVVLDGGSR